MCPSQTPSGRAITAEISTPIALTFSVSRVRCTSVGSCGSPGIPPLRPMNSNASMKTFRGSP